MLRSCGLLMVYVECRLYTVRELVVLVVDWYMKLTSRAQHHIDLLASSFCDENFADLFNDLVVPSGRE
jgi:hypothetical protein